MGHTSSTTAHSTVGSTAPAGAARKLSSVFVGDLNSGDVILVARTASTAMGALDAGLVRAMAASTRGNSYSVQQQHLLGWTHCGLIVSHKGKPYLLLPTTEGVDVLPAAKQISRWALEGVKVAVRQLAASDLDAERIASVCRDLLHAALQGCAWSAFLPELKQDEAGRTILPRDVQRMRLPRAAASTGSAPTATTSVASRPGTAGVTTVRDGAVDRADAALAPLSRQLLRMLVPRVWAALRAVPPRVEVELRRAFARADADGDGLVTAGDVKRILTDVRGGDISRAEADAFLRRMGPPAALRVASDEVVSTAGSHNAALGAGAGASPSSAAVTPGAASIALYSLDHFLLAFARRPLTELPVEADPAALLCGEFVATVYELLGLLPLRTASALTPADAYASASSRNSSRSATGSGIGAGHHDVHGGGGGGGSPGSGPHTLHGSSAGSSPLRTLTANCGVSPANPRTATSGSGGDGGAGTVSAGADSPHHFPSNSGVAAATLSFGTRASGGDAIRSPSYTGVSNHADGDHDDSDASGIEKNSPSRSSLGVTGAGIASPAAMRNRAYVSLSGMPSHGPPLSTGRSESGSVAAGSSIAGSRRSSTGTHTGSGSHGLFGGAATGIAVAGAVAGDGRRRLSGLADALASAAAAAEEAEEAERASGGLGLGVVVSGGVAGGLSHGFDDAIGVSVGGGGGDSARRYAAAAESKNRDGDLDLADAATGGSGGLNAATSRSGSGAATPQRGSAFPIGPTSTPPSAALRSAAVQIVPLHGPGSGAVGAGAAALDACTEQGSGRRGSGRSSVSSIGAATARILGLIDGAHATGNSGGGSGSGSGSGFHNGGMSSSGPAGSASDGSHVALAVSARLGPGDAVSVSMPGFSATESSGAVGLTGRSGTSSSNGAKSAGAAAVGSGSIGSEAGNNGSTWWTRTSSGAGGASPSVTRSGSGVLTSASAGSSGASGAGGLSLTRASTGAGSGHAGSASSGSRGASTLVLIDSACGDLRHFTPSTFSTSHVPRLALLRGHLEPEALIDVSTADTGTAATGLRSDSRSASGTAGAGASAGRAAIARGGAGNGPGSGGTSGISVGASAPHLAPAAAATIQQLTAGVFTSRSATSASATSHGSSVTSTTTSRPVIAAASSAGPPAAVPSTPVPLVEGGSSAAAASSSHMRVLSTFSLAVHGAESSSSPELRAVSGAASGPQAAGGATAAGSGHGTGGAQLEGRAGAGGPALYTSLSRATVAWSEESTGALMQGGSPAAVTGVPAGTGSAVVRARHSESKAAE